ncbi:thioesterase family protein [Pseudonocardia sp. ICBG1142]|uniref:acyl-CoA thioesterase n=1 Tax=Pseudonocardia sp. ICBG1142 TaxID=2846760 RepID=UPI001CF715EB|nr:thioesterase family protein [Pseudonocardia sp. ICBG1142]
MANFEFPVRVRYHEVDAQGVVFNAWYLAWFDEAMTEFLEHRGLTYRAMLDAGYDIQLVHTELDWRAGVGSGPRQSR